MLEAALGGLITGSFYALVASGFALILGVTRVFNLAHGDLVILGAYVGERLFRLTGWSPILLMPLAALPAMLLAVAYRPLLTRAGEPFGLRAAVMTFGASLVIQSGLQSAFTADFRLIAVPEWDRGVRVLGAMVVAGRLAVAAAALLLLVCLHLLYTRTFFGKSLRAVSSDREAAALAGINPARVDRFTLALGGALAGAAGPLFAALQYVTPSAGIGPTLTAIVLTIFAGVGSMRGLLLGGLLLGMVEAMTAWAGGATWRDMTSLAMLLLLLRWRGSPPAPSPGNSGGRRGGGGRLMHGGGLPNALSRARVPFRWSGVAAGVLMLLLPILVGPRDYFIYLGTMAVVLSLLAQSWGLLAQAGLISFGHAAFFGVGAYGSALLSLRWQLSPWIALLLAALLAAAFGLVAAAMVGDLTGPHFSLATLAMAELLRLVALHWADLTEGAWGLVGVPGLPPVPIPGLEAFPGFAAARATNYYAALTMLAAVCGLCAWIQRAPLGLAFEAIRQGEERAAALGVDARRVKRIALAVSGLFAGGAGALHAHIFRWVDPASAFSLHLSVLPLVMAMFGGSAYLLGPSLGAVVLYLGNELVFQRLAPGGHLWLYGGAVMLVILCLPNGLLGWLEARVGERRGAV